MMYTTAISYVLLGTGLWLFGWKFLNSYRLAKANKLPGLSGLLIALISFSIAALASVNALVIFFLPYSRALFFTDVLAHLAITSAAALAIYFVAHMRLIPFTPWKAASLVVLLGLGTVWLHFVFPEQPFIDANGGVHWQIPFLMAACMMILFDIVLVPLGYVFSFSFIFAKSPESKQRSLLLLFLIGGSLIAAFVDLILTPSIGMSTIARDSVIALLGICFIVSSNPFPRLYDRLMEMWTK